MSANRFPFQLLRLLLVATAWLFVQAAGAVGESLHYKVTYRGVFSLGRDLPIVDLEMRNAAAVAAPGGLFRTELSGTSSAYSLVESLYPIRLQFRSWGDAGGDLVAFESFEQTDKVRHKLYLRDDTPIGVRVLDVAAGEGRDALDRLEAGRALPVPAGDAHWFDRLGMLQQVRASELHEGRRFEFPVTNGRHSLRYRVTVERADTLHLGGRALAAWKVRFDGFEVDGSGRETAAHRPVYFWLAQASGHAPLRADARHAIGLFRIELVGQLPDGLLAQTAR